MRVISRWQLLVLSLVLTASLAVGCGSDHKPIPVDDVDAMMDLGDGGNDEVDAPDNDAKDGVQETDSPDVPQPATMAVCISTKAGCLDAPSGSALLLTLEEHDTNQNVPGLQVGVHVTLENVPTGSRVELLRDGAVLQFMDVPSSSFEFSSISLTHATEPDCPVYTVRIQDMELESTTTLCANTGGCAPKLTPVSPFCQDTDANPALAGFQMEFTVTSLVEGCQTAWLTWGTDGVMGPVTLANGSAVMQVTLSDKEKVTCESVEVVAHVTDADHPEREESASALFSLTNTQPEVTIVAPTGPTINGQADEDANLTNGIDFTLEGTLGNAGSEAEASLWVQRPGEADYALEATVPASGELFSFPVNLPITGPYKFRVQVADCCGHMGEGVLSLVAILDTADLRIVSPYEETTLLSKDNGPAGDSTHYDVPFVVQAPAVAVGDEVAIECRSAPPGSAWSTVGSIQADSVSEDHLQTVPVLLDTSLLGNDAVCRARHQDGGTPTQSPYIGLQIGLPAPLLVVSMPEADQLLDPSMLEISGQSQAREWKGLAYRVLSGGTVESEGALEVDLDAAAEYGFYATVDVSGLFDGAYTLVVEGEDLFGNLASEQTGNVTEVPVYLDSLPPELTPLYPFTPYFVCALPSCSDTVAVRSGHQVDIKVKVTGEQRPDLTEVCLESNGGSPLCSMAGLNGASWEAAFYGVTLLNGSNELVASGTDGLGHISQVSWSVTLATLAPRVELIEPAKDLVTGATQITVQAAVKHPTTLAPLEDAAVALLVNGQQVGVGTYVGEGVYTMTLTGLTPDVPVEVQVSAAHDSFPANVGYSDIRRVTSKSLLPAIQLVTLQNGAVVNMSFSGCKPGLPGCTLDVSATTTNVEEGQEAQLTGDCLANAITAKVVDEKLLFPLVPLPDNTTCSLQATVIDAAGAEATTGPVTVVVDRTAPKLCRFVSPAYSILPAEWDENISVEGFQYTVQIAADRLEAGQVLQLAVKGPSGTAQVVYLDVPSNISAANCVPFTFPQLTMEYGLNTLTVSTVDDAGNAAQLVQTTEFAESATSVEFYITSYEPPTSCSSSDQCEQGVCATVGGSSSCMLGWRAASQSLAVQSYPVSLFSGFSSVRLCSNAPGLTGAACASEGTYRVVKTFDSLGGYQTLELTKTEVMALPQGKHNFMVEAKRQDDGTWVSSLDSPNVYNRYRDIYVDTIAPVVGDITFPTDTLAPTGTLNSLEVAAGSTYLVNVMLGDAIGGRVELWANAALVGDFPIAAATFEAYVPLAQGSNPVCAIAYDLVGNQALQYCESITVDTQAPYIVFQSPSSSPLLEGSSPDVVVYTDAVSSTVLLERKQSGSFVEISGKPASSSGQATFAGAMISDGTYEFRASVSDPAGNVAATLTSPAQVIVDRTPPTVDILQPAQGASLAPTDDAMPTLGGFQVMLLFNTTDVATWQVETIRCSDATYNNCEAPVVKPPVSVVDSGNGQYAATVTLGKMLLPIEYRRMVVTVVDSNGNSRTDQVDIQVTAGGCTVTFIDTSEKGYWNNSLCEIPGEDCDQATVPVDVVFFGPCGDVTGIELYVDGTSFGTTTAQADGTGTFSLPVQHGEVFSLEARLLTSTGPTAFGSGAWGFEGDFHSPTTSFISPSVTPFVCNMQVDDSSTATGCQTVFDVQVADENLAGGSLSLWQSTGSEATMLVQQTATATPQLASLPVALQEADSSTVELQATDDAGNTGSVTLDAVVDVTPPSEVVLSAIDGVADVNRRLPAATLRWTAPGDDGSQGSALEYQVRYALGAIATQAEFDAACDVADLLATPAVQAPAAGGTAEEFTITGPDTRDPGSPCLWRVSPTVGSRYYFAVQATDHAGNVSPVTASSTQYTDALTLRYLKLDRGSIPSVGFGSMVFSVGDIEGDGYDDVVVGGDPAVRGFCVVRGGAESLTQIDVSTESNRVHCITDDYNSDVGRVGCGVGDVNGDGYRDFVTRVVFNETGDMITHYRLYLGNADGFFDDSYAALFIVDNTTIISSASCAGLGNVNGDLTTNGRHLDDFALSGAGLNTLFVISGHESLTSMAPMTIDLTQAPDRATWDVARIQCTDCALGEDFGFNSAKVGNILPDAAGGPFDDIIVASYGPPTAVYLIPGRAWTGSLDISVSANLSGTGSEDAVAIKLGSDTPLVCGDGLGDEILGNRDLDGDGVLDVALTHPCYSSFAQNSHYLFWGSYLAGKQGQTVKLGSPYYANYGINVSAGGYRVLKNTYSMGYLDDFDGSGASTGGAGDLVFGDFNGLGTDYGHIYIRFNDGGSYNPYIIYPYVDLTITDPYVPGSQAFAMRVVTPGDFNGDGAPDILASTNEQGYAVLVY